MLGFRSTPPNSCIQFSVITPMKCWFRVRSSCEYSKMNLLFETGFMYPWMLSHLLHTWGSPSCLCVSRVGLTTWLESVLEMKSRSFQKTWDTALCMSISKASCWLGRQRQLRGNLSTSCIVFRKKWVSQLINSFDISVSETEADNGCLAPDLAG